MNLKQMLNRIDEQKKLLESRRPLSDAEVKNLKDYYKIGLTYTSNALEGNTYNLSETKVLLEDGLTVGGRPMKDALEVVGHGDAFDFMYELASDDTQITEDHIKKLHSLFYSRIDDKNAGKYRTENVFITGANIFRLPEIIYPN